MFTGIITHRGEVVAIKKDTGEGGSLRLLVSARFTSGLKAGDSVACDGCCLTLEGKPEVGANGGSDVILSFGLSPETLARTTFRTMDAGWRINLERAARLGDEIGGHLVSGHIDATATLIESIARGENREMHFRYGRELSHFVADKGSLALNGVSLTVNSASADKFTVMLIAHTLKQTNLGAMREGGEVNLEIDLIARYISRILRERS
ncbi:MAG: riboflavin synthase [Alphaproteobacteria bacterium]